jgi:hypothetical protein
LENGTGNVESTGDENLESKAILNYVEQDSWARLPRVDILIN